MLQSRVICEESFTIVSVRAFMLIVISSKLCMPLRGVSIYDNDETCEQLVR